MIKSLINKIMWMMSLSVSPTSSSDYQDSVEGFNSHSTDVCPSRLRKGDRVNVYIDHDDQVKDSALMTVKGVSKVKPVMRHGQFYGNKVVVHYVDGRGYETSREYLLRYRDKVRRAS